MHCTECSILNGTLQHKTWLVGQVGVLAQDDCNQASKEAVRQASRLRHQVRQEVLTSSSSRLSAAKHVSKSAQSSCSKLKISICTF